MTDTPTSSTHTPAWRDPRVLGAIVGGLLFGLILALVGTTMLRAQWAEVASRSLWAKTLFAFGAVGYVVMWGRIVRETYSNVRRDIRDMAHAEPSTLRCIRCGQPYPSPHYFSAHVERLCRVCEEILAPGEPHNNQMQLTRSAPGEVARGPRS